LKKIIVAFLSLNLLLLASNQERDLQAVLIGRLAQFVQWNHPKEHLFRITVIGNNPFGDLLNRLYEKKKIDGKSVEIKHIAHLEEIGQADILFVALENQQEVQEAILYAIKNSILTIGTQRGFAQRGGIVQLSFVMQKPRLVINHKTAQYSNIKIQAPLLAIAQEIIKGDE